MRLPLQEQRIFLLVFRRKNNKESACGLFAPERYCVAINFFSARCASHAERFLFDRDTYQIKKALHPVNRTRALYRLYHLITMYSISHLPNLTYQKCSYFVPCNVGKTSVLTLTADKAPSASFQAAAWK